MNNYDVKRLALILAIQSEIEGMKALNSDRLQNNHTIAYMDDSFFEKAEELRNLASKHDDQL